MTTRTLPLLLCLVAAVCLSGNTALGGARKEPSLMSQLPVDGDRYAKRCQPTPYHTRANYPGSPRIPGTNSLARPGGKSVFAEGQRVYLRGRVFDEACVPLKGAKVEIWHTDREGLYYYVKSGDLVNPYPVFTGAGQVTTDNRGEYVFETIFPGPRGNQTPHVNMRISHPSMRRPLRTTLYFAGDHRNEDDRRYQRLNDKTRELVTATVRPFDSDDIEQGLLVFHDITVLGRDHFRDF